jgi:hypothetical protein
LFLKLLGNTRRIPSLGEKSVHVSNRERKKVNKKSSRRTSAKKGRLTFFFLARTNVLTIEEKTVFCYIVAKLHRFQKLKAKYKKMKLLNQN